MAPSHHHRNNMGWRKPVPRLSPESSSATSPYAHSRGVQRLSLTIINKEMPPLPTDWRETRDHAIKKERRHAVYLSTPPVPPPKDFEYDSDPGYGSRPSSLAITLVEDQPEEDPTMQSPVPPPPQREDESIECVERRLRSPAQPENHPAIARRASQKSLPKIYRPPTPPLPAQPRKLRSVGHSRESYESQTYTLSPGQTLAEQREATTPCPSVLTSWPSRLAPDVSVTLHSHTGSRSRVLSFTGKDSHRARGSGSPRAHRRSATSTSTGNRSSSGRSQFTCHMCNSVWYALKGLAVHIRAKMAPARTNKY